MDASGIGESCLMRTVQTEDGSDRCKDDVDDERDIRDDHAVVGIETNHDRADEQGNHGVRRAADKGGGSLVDEHGPDIVEDLPRLAPGEFIDRLTDVGVHGAGDVGAVEVAGVGEHHLHDEVHHEVARDVQKHAAADGGEQVD